MLQQLQEQLEQKSRENELLRGSLADLQARLSAILEKLEQQQKFSSLLQKFLLPTEVPQYPGLEISTKFLPGQERGGDYFDVFPIEDSMKFGILLSSSSGYSMSALFLSVLIQFTSRFDMNKTVTPDELLKKIADTMKPDIPPQQSCSLFFGILDRRNFVLQHSSVGKMMGFLQTGGQGRLVKIEPSAPEISPLFAGEPLSSEVALGPKDRLLLVSNGILEAKNQSQEAFGFERLTAAVEKATPHSLHDVRNEILFQVQNHCGLSHTSETREDQTLVVLEVKDRVIKLA